MMARAGGRPRNPYVGPRAFTEDEADLFFGREQEVEILASLVLSRRAVLFFAQSGAGKSSLLRAGLIPALTKIEKVGHIRPPTHRRDYQRMRVLPILTVGESAASPGEEPPACVYVWNALQRLLPTEPAAGLAGRTLSEGLAPSLPAAEDTDAMPTLLIFDQFEEIFTHLPTRLADREDFFRQVAAALDAFPSLHILFTMREEYIAELTRFVGVLPDRLRAQFRLELLGEEAALQAIQRPAQAAGVDFTDGAAQKLVNDLRQTWVQQPDGTRRMETGSTVEPVQLQVVCHSLWEKLSPGAVTIVEQDLVAVGNVDQALTAYYDDKVAAAARSSRVSRAAIRSWFDHKLITEQGMRGLVPEGRERTAGLPNGAIPPFVQAHLVRSEKRHGATFYELSHDRLIEPIRRSNKAWDETRRRRWLTVGAVTIVVAILAAVAIIAGAALWQGSQTAGLKATAAAAAEVQASATQTIEDLVTSYMQQGQGHVDQRAYDRAVTAYGEAIKLDPQNANAFYQRALAYLGMNDYKAAVADLDQAIALGFSQPGEAYFQRGHAYEQMGDNERALADYDQAIALDPENAVAYCNRSAVHGRRGNYTQSVDDASQAIRLKPDYAMAYNNRGVSYYYLQSYNLALADLNECLRLDPAYAKAYNNRAKVYAALGNTKQATADYVQAGRVYRDAGDTTRAVDAYNEALQLDPAYALAYYERGQINAELGNQGQAVSDYSQAIELGYEPAGQAYTARADALRLMGVPQAALADYDQAIKLDPTYAPAFYGRALVYEEQDAPTQVVSDLTQAIKADKGYTEAYFQRGLAYYRQGDYRRAMSDLTRAIELDPNNAEYHSWRAQAAYARGDDDQAIADYVQAMRLDADQIVDARDVYRLDVDGNEETSSEEWVVFYQLAGDMAADVGGPAPWYGIVVDGDGCTPPRLQRFDLAPPGSPSLAIRPVKVEAENAIVYADPLSGDQDRPELVVSARTGRIVTDLTLFRRVGPSSVCSRDEQQPPALQAAQMTQASQQGYQNVGVFRGSVSVARNGELVTVVDASSFERSELVTLRQYRPQSGSYLDPAAAAPGLLAPVELSMGFEPGSVDLTASESYPEKAVVAFYLALTQDPADLARARRYLSDAALDRYDPAADPFGLSTDPASVAPARAGLARVLIWELRYTPDAEAEQTAAEREVTAVVVGVDPMGNVDISHPCQVTWTLVALPDPAARPAGRQWRLDRYVNTCQ